MGGNCASRDLLDPQVRGDANLWSTSLSDIDTKVNILPFPQEVISIAICTMSGDNSSSLTAGSATSSGVGTGSFAKRLTTLPRTFGRDHLTTLATADLIPAALAYSCSRNSL